MIVFIAKFAISLIIINKNIYYLDVQADMIIIVNG